jgi:hypothetical protein
MSPLRTISKCRLVSAVLAPVDRPRQRESSHYSNCPHCGRSTFIAFSEIEAVFYGGCVHLRQIMRQGSSVSVVFEGAGFD